MATYTVQTKAYELDEWDEENDCPIPGKVIGYKVFTTIQINEYTFVRAVVETPDASAAKPRAREWFVEWKRTIGVSSATSRLTGKLTRADALRKGEYYAALIADKAFDDAESFFDFCQQHLPKEPTYGH